MSEVAFEPLLSPKQAASALGISVDTLRALVSAGELRFIDVGNGKKRIRRMFDPSDLAQFCERRRRVQSCPSTNRKARKSTSSTSKWRGDRFSGSTGVKSKREALQVEQARRDALKRDADAQAARNGQAMTLDEACGKHWDEVGQHAKNVKAVEWSYEYLLKHLGDATVLKAITDAEVAQLVAKRRGDRVDNVMVRKNKTRKDAKRVSAATVNRSVTEPLRRILLRARDVWGEEVAPIAWKKHKLKEPKERIRSMSAAEEQKLFAALPAAYEPIVRFALRTGCRVMECVNLRWRDIDWGNRRIQILGKGDKLASIPMAIDVRDLLFPLQGQHGEFVFMMPPPVRKDLFPEPPRRMTYRALYSAFLVATKKAGISSLRIHDLRHTAATRLLAKTGNLKMAMKLLRHEDISTTSKYAAVLDDDLREALDAMSAQEIPGKSPVKEAKSLKKRAPY